MYNKKSKASAILTICAAALLIGLMVMLPCLKMDAGDTDDAGAAVGAVFAMLIFILGCLPLYASSIAFSIVGLIFGIKMLKEQGRQQLISLNKRVLIATCVLFPILAIGLILSSTLIFSSTLGQLPIIYTFVAVVVYLAALIAQIVAIVILKKSPEETDSAVA